MGSFNKLQWRERGIVLEIFYKMGLIIVSELVADISEIVIGSVDHFNSPVKSTYTKEFLRCIPGILKKLAFQFFIVEFMVVAEFKNGGFLVIGFNQVQHFRKFSVLHGFGMQNFF